jgi:cyanate lyase
MQFLDWVRTHYHLNTNQLNADFCKTLAAKSGIDEATLEELVACIGEIRLQAVPITDAYLYKVYSLIQKCYKNKPQ